jgi:hypothetical protein
MSYEKSKINLPSGFINLGEPIKAMEIDLSEAKPTSDYHYPSLYFDNAEGLEKLPKEGTATIYFKKTMERKETVTRNGKTEKRHMVELCICGIKPEGSSESETMEEEEDDEDAIEMGLKAAEEGGMEENEEETEEEDED